MVKTSVFRSARTPLMVATLAAALLLTLTMGVRADQHETGVDTNAEVDAVTTPPNIECKWEIPDMDSSTAGIQYVRVDDSGTHHHDDDNSVVPDANNDSDDGTQVPCDLGGELGLPTMPDGVQRSIQVNPNLEDNPEERQVDLWMAVDHPNGISNITDVYWRVFHPDGSEKVQVHGNKIPVGECDTLGTGVPSTDGKSPWHAAIHSGQVSQEAVHDTDKGMIARCQQEIKALYHQKFTISKDQPCGEYRIEATAVGNGGATQKLNNYIDVHCVFALETDFDGVDWGAITPGLTDVVGGDLIWDDPAANAPTLKNIGNDGMGVRLQFDQMVGANEGKIIDTFDAKFGRDPGTLLSLDPIFAGDVADFGTDPAQVLCANELGKLDLSIHPPNVLPADSYSGSLTVMGYDAHAEPMTECKGNQHLSEVS